LTDAAKICDIRHKFFGFAVELAASTSGRIFMRQILFVASCVVATLLSTTFAGATMRITSDRGGRIIDYVERFMQARASGEHVVIDGFCLSACTLVVGMLPRDQVCVTRNAVLGFHAAWRPTADGRKVSSHIATQVMMDVYPPELRSWIGRRGGLTTRLLLLEGRELAGIVSTCGGAATNVVTAAVHSPRVTRSDSSRATYDAQQAR
jgi:hypothetical protein